jgi:transposase
MPHLKRIAHFLMLPELKLTAWKKTKPIESTVQARKTSEFEVCPKCATPSRSVYDHRLVTIKDSPIRGHGIRLRIKKRRFYCKTCRKPFTEPLQGVRKSHRTTERYRREVLWAAESFSDLSRVRRSYQCSSGLLYKILYDQLELRRRRRINYPWPTTIGIDEHFFTRKHGRAEFVTVFTDFNNKRLREVVHGKIKGELIEKLKPIEGRENVKNVVIDLSDGYRSFVKDFFPYAQIIADKFHVMRLITPAINKARIEIQGDKRKNPSRRLLLMRFNRLEYFERKALHEWLEHHPRLKELYMFKEAIHRFYRTKGFNRAATALTRLTDAMAHSQLKEIKRLRRTFMYWRVEILNYFKTGLTNARTEGFNNVAKLVQKRAYGYKNFENYRP